MMNTQAAVSTPRARDYVTMNLYYMGLSFMWNSIGRFLLQAILPQPNMAGSANAEGALGLIGFVGLLIATIVQPIAGSISDRFPSRWGRRRPFMLAFTLTDLIFLAAIAFAPNFLFLFIAYCLLQFSSNLAHGPYQGLLSDLVPEEKRGIASSVKQFMDTGTLVIVAVLLPLVFTNAQNVESNVRVAMGLVAFFLVGTMFANVLFTREVPSLTAAAPRARTNLLASSREAVRAAPAFMRAYPDFTWLVAARLATLGALAFISNYAQFYFQKVLLAGIGDLDQAIKAAVKLQGDLLTVVVLALIVFTLVAGPLSDRWGRKPIVAIGSLLGGAGALGLMFVRNVPLVQLPGLAISDLIASGVLIGIGMGLFTSANWAWAIDLTPRDKGGQFLGLTNFATAGATVVTSVFGPVISLLNAQQAGSGFTFMFIVATGGFLLGALLLVKVKETRGKKVTSRM